MLEKHFQAWVVDLARWHGWRVHHTRTVQIAGGGWTSPGLDRGFPDLILVRDGDIIIAELKSDTGKPTQTQLEWIRLLASAGVETVVWQPKDMAHITERLAPLRSHVRQRSRME